MSEMNVILNSSRHAPRAHSHRSRNCGDATTTASEVVLVGIQRGGVHLAQRLANILKEIWNHPVPVGTLDVSMHRDDLGQHSRRKIQPTVIPFDINGQDGRAGG